MVGLVLGRRGREGLDVGAESKRSRAAAGELRLARRQRRPDGPIERVHRPHVATFGG
jgi:hypothetical protein